MAKRTNKGAYCHKDLNGCMSMAHTYPGFWSNDPIAKSNMAKDIRDTMIWVDTPTKIQLKGAISKESYDKYMQLILD